MTLNGVINVLKPPGMTSHDVIYFIRRILQTKKVGHTGTLDPAAAGVLPVCVGMATRIAEYITGYRKSYRAELTFGITTATYDCEGQVLSCQDAGFVCEQLVKAIVPDFIGSIKQRPPMTSAVKINGKRCYELAHQGIQVECPLREITIDDLRVVQWITDGEHPRCLLDIDCSKGTYVRSLCHDIGQALGCGAYMSALLRTKVGHFDLAHSFTLEEIEQRIKEQHWDQISISLTDALSFMPKYVLEQPEADRFCHGQMLTLHQPISAGTVAVFGNSGQLIAIGEFDDATLVLRPHKVFASDDV